MQEISTLKQGQSYWKARLVSRTICELDIVTDIRHAQTRRTEWLEDVIGSGDLAKVVEIILCSPQGEIHLPVNRPNSAFQLNQGIKPLLAEGKIKTAQIIGSVHNDLGDCVAAVWDIQSQKLYEFHTNIYNFKAWRPGVADLGRLNIEALGVSV